MRNIRGIAPYLPREGPAINDDGRNSYISYFCKKLLDSQCLGTLKSRILSWEKWSNLVRGRKLFSHDMTSDNNLCIAPYLPREGPETIFSSFYFYY